MMILKSKFVNYLVSLLFTLFFISNTSISHLCAQEINWALEPVITDVDNIDLSESKQSELFLIRVKKGSKWGIKNPKNEIILPIEYQTTVIWNDKYCEGRNGRDQYFFDHEGYEVEYDEVDALQKKLSEKNRVKKKERELAELNEKFPNVEFSEYMVRSSYRFAALNKETGDTLTKAAFPKTFFVTSALYSLDSGEKYTKVIKNETGEVVGKIERTISVDEREHDLHILRDGKWRGLFDERFNEILPFEYRWMNILDENYVEASKDGDNYDIYDRKGNLIPNTTGTSIYKTDGGIIFISKGDYKTGIFNAATGKVTDHNFKVRGKPLGKNNVYRVVNTDTLSGLFDFDTNKELLPCKYRRASVQGNLFIGGNYYQKKKRRFRTVYALKTIFNAKGEKILQDSIKSFIKINSDNIFVTDDKGGFRRFNGKGELLETLPEGYQIHFLHNKYISVQPKGKKNFIHIDDYLTNKKAEGFDGVSKPTSSKDKKSLSYVVSRGKKKGIVDAKGKIVIPIELDKLENESGYKKYLIAKKDGKWGAIHNPLYRAAK